MGEHNHVAYRGNGAPFPRANIRHPIDYVQVVFNGCIAFGALFLLARFVQLVQYDVQLQRAQQHLEDAFTIQQCAKYYEENRCGGQKQPPALAERCARWAQCMALDAHPTSDASVRLWARTLASTLNEFTEQVSLRTVIVLLVCTLSVILAANFAFGTYRVYYVQQRT
ncbi:AFR261Wp [Eremothecium gossypii ATCC 10895]|uniref:AFR261Wp n=1 Tax=Eremothecium gossypii (strain ATCC 10895 / CBS 109.51 / FGSC 9923 / NRRL Y-1056) TaxID=284811 RepID=Q753R5_EREGS|nr:AFR261Wp [Eremothecium gossypii ATCC 10895]AAS53632.1 AFR261Wp [Eremothecium gossypii ATCC 10895]AEY97945.1 FAFR261Wp [Eremothecium gossypii FDAG1]